MDDAHNIAHLHKTINFLSLVIGILRAVYYKFAYSLLLFESEDHQTDQTTKIEHLLDGGYVVKKKHHH